jgi:hypothetical protein
MRIHGASLAWLVLIATLDACGGPTPFDVSLDTNVGLVQTVRVSNVEPKQGEHIDFLSTVKNPTASPIDAVILVGTLGFSGNLRIENTNNFSLGFGPLSAPVAPGDSLIEAVSMIVQSPPGVYSVQVHHIVDPDVAVTVQITVK